MSELMCELCGMEPSKFLFGGKRVGQKCAAIVMKADKAQPSVFRIGGFEATVIRKALRNEVARAYGSSLERKFDVSEYEHAVVLIARLNRGIKEKQF